VAGIVSERDIVRILAANAPDALSDSVVKHMTRPVHTCSERHSTVQIMEEMTRHRFRHLPVVENGKLCGIVSIGDVVKQRIAEAELEALTMRQYIATG
jgi:CBS domain-containing protein